MKKNTLFIILAVFGGISLVAGCVEEVSCTTCAMSGQTPVTYCDSDNGGVAAYDAAVAAATAMGYTCTED